MIIQFNKFLKRQHTVCQLHRSPLVFANNQPAS